jgi:hypothetical protein
MAASLGMGVFSSINEIWVATSAVPWAYLADPLVGRTRIFAYYRTGDEARQAFGGDIPRTAACSDSRDGRGALQGMARPSAARRLRGRGQPQ